MKKNTIKFDSAKYISQYQKEHYRSLMVRLPLQDYTILTNFSDNLQLSKSSLLQKCLLYCHKNDIDFKKRVEFRNECWSMESKQVKTLFKANEAKILDEYILKTGLSKNELIRRCMLYCWKEMIDVSDIKLSSAEDYKED